MTLWVVKTVLFRCERNTNIIFIMITDHSFCQIRIIVFYFALIPLFGDQEILGDLHSALLHHAHIPKLVSSGRGADKRYNKALHGVARINQWDRLKKTIRTTCLSSHHWTSRAYVPRHTKTLKLASDGVWNTDKTFIISEEKLLRAPLMNWHQSPYLRQYVLLWNNLQMLPLWLLGHR